MADRDPVEMSPRTGRLLRALLPAGALLLVLWVAFGPWAIATGATADLSIVSMALGLITSLG